MAGKHSILDSKELWISHMSKILRIIIVTLGIILGLPLVGVLLMILVYGWGQGEEKRAFAMAQKLMERNSLSNEMFGRFEAVTQDNGISIFYWYEKNNKNHF